MTIKPILFSGPMVRAIIEGRKTQTRRVLKVQPVKPLRLSVINDGIAIFRTNAFAIRQDVKLNFQVGDLLYVREAWRVPILFDDTPPSKLPAHILKDAHYIADGESWNPLWQTAKYRQGMHMPRAASRITLKVTDVRVERLQDISEQDAIAEGLEWYEDEHRPDRDSGWQCYPKPEPGQIGLSTKEPVSAFRSLWNSINATRKQGIYEWNNNPWVIATTFESIFCNIDNLDNPDMHWKPA